MFKYILIVYVTTIPLYYDVNTVVSNVIVSYYDDIQRYTYICHDNTMYYDVNTVVSLL